LLTLNRVYNMTNKKTKKDPSDIFGPLYGDTENSVKAIQKGPVNVSSQLEELEKEKVAISKITDESEKKKREKILSSKFDTLRVAMADDEKDMAKAIYGIQALINGMDDQFQDLIKLTPEEQEIIDDAEKELKNSESALESSKNKLVIEESKDGFFARFGKKTRLKNIKQSIVDSKTALKQSQEDLITANKAAKEKQRERLMSAEIEQSIGTLQVMGQKTVDIMNDRSRSVKESLETIKARKEKDFKIMEDAVQRTQKHLAEIEKKETELQNEEIALDSYEVNTEAYVEQSKKVSKLSSELEKVRGNLKVAQAVLDEKTKSTSDLKLFEEGQQKLLSNHRMWIATIKSKLEVNLDKDAAYLEMLQAASDQEVAESVDSLTSEKDLRQNDTVAQIIVASDKAYIKKLQSTPEQMKRRANVQKAIAQHKANLSESEKEILESMKNKYGIDPFQLSEFTHRSDKSNPSGKNDGTPSTPTNSSNDDNLFGDD